MLLSPAHVRRASETAAFQLTARLFFSLQVEAYVDFEGREKGMSQAECEDEVLRFLQRKSLMEEGSFDGWKDPQTVVTFGLLAALVVGISRNFVSQQLGGVAQ